MDGMFEKWGGGEVLRKAVRGMLPKNRLRDKRLARLKTFEGWSHPYKENIVKVHGSEGITGLPEIAEAFEAERAEASKQAESIPKL
jgi:large subunit ribosomal protein L13